jgi:hypothetical protein
MAEEITAFQLDDSLADIMADTQDETVNEIGTGLWYFYDDINDHKIVASKTEWDFFNRLLLLLESDGEIEIKNIRRWNWRQVIAAICVGTFGIIVYQSGFGEHLLIYSIPFGIVSMFLYWLANHEEKKANNKRDKIEELLSPFSSFSNLRFVHNQIPNFRKWKYPQTIAGRRIRTRASDKIMMFKWGIIWLMFAPIPLLFQMLPYNETSSLVNIPQPDASSDATRPAQLS